MTWHGSPDEDAFTLSEPAYSLLSYAYAYASKFETDGCVPLHQLRSRKAYQFGIKPLLDGGYLIPREGEMMEVRDYLLVGNKTKDEIEAGRAKTRERVKEWRERKRSNMLQDVHKQRTCTPCNASAPAPALEDSKESSLVGRASHADADSESASPPQTRNSRKETTLPKDRPLLVDLPREKLGKLTPAQIAGEWYRLRYSVAYDGDLPTEGKGFWVNWARLVKAHGLPRVVQTTDAWFDEEPPWKLREGRRDWKRLAAHFDEIGPAPEDITRDDEERFLARWDRNERMTLARERLLQLVTPAGETQKELFSPIDPKGRSNGQKTQDAS